MLTVWFFVITPTPPQYGTVCTFTIYFFDFLHCFNDFSGTKKTPLPTPLV